MSAIDLCELLMLTILSTVNIVRKINIPRTVILWSQSLGCSKFIRQSTSLKLLILFYRMAKIQRMTIILSIVTFSNVQYTL